MSTERQPQESSSTSSPTTPDAQEIFRRITIMVSCYLTLSVVTLGVAALLRNDAKEVTSAVWVRGTIVTLSAILTLLFTRRAARGSRRAFLRLRLISAIMVVAIVVIVSIPGVFPIWMRIEQSVCGLLLLGVVLTVNAGRTRALFATAE